MANMIQACSNLHGARTFLLHTRLDEIAESEECAAQSHIKTTLINSVRIHENYTNAVILLVNIILGSKFHSLAVLT